MKEHHVSNRFEIVLYGNIVHSSWSIESAQKAWAQLFHNDKSPKGIIYEGKRKVGYFNEKRYVIQQQLF